MKNVKKVMLSFMMLFAVLLSACSLSKVPDATATLWAIYTSAAQTVQAQNAQTLQPTGEVTVTYVPIATLTPMPPSTLLPTLPASTPSSAPVCDNYIYITDVTVRDGTTMNASQTFVKTWMVQNTGTCTWDANYTLTFVTGDQMSGAATAIGISVAPGQQAQVSVTLTAPSSAGQYTGYWRLANDAGTLLGQTLSVVINVTGGTATPAETATYYDTYTPGPSPTPTSTRTPRPTSTPHPSRTPSPTPTPK
jgi:hypothetical protein